MSREKHPFEDASGANAPAIDYSKKWYVMVTVAMGTFLATIDGSIVNVALPSLHEELNAPFSTVQWVVLAYLLTLATLLLSVGRLADIVGKKRIYNAGFVVFIVGSAICGLSPTVHWLIGSRVFQAVGAAMVLALGMAIVTEAFPPSERGKALGISGAIVSIGVVIGPTVGGLLLSVASWRSIFFVNVPVGFAGALLAFKNIPDIRPVGKQHFDYRGAIAMLVALLSMLFALTLSQDRGFGDRGVLGLMTLSVLAGVLFVANEKRDPQPMIDLALFRNRLFSINLVTGLLTFVASSGSVLLQPFYLEGVLGFSTRQMGLLLSVVPIAVGVIAPFAGALSDRLGTRAMTACGLALLSVGYAISATMRTDTTALGYALRFIPLAIGVGIFQSPNNSAIMGSASREHLGVVSGMLAVMRTLGQTTGVATIGALWAGRVAYYAGGPVEGGATQAAAQWQVMALNETHRSLALLVGVAFALALWAFVEERRSRVRPAAYRQSTQQ